MPEKLMITVTKSKKVILERVDQPEWIFTNEISGLRNTGDLIGVEFMTSQKVLVACSSRKCAIVEYDRPGLKERIINLGESVTSIFFNSFSAILGTVDSSKNSVAFYKIDELVWYRHEELIEEFDFLDYRSSNPIRCRGDRHLHEFSILANPTVVIQGKRCDCDDSNMYSPWYSGSLCFKCTTCGFNQELNQQTFCYQSFEPVCSPCPNLQQFDPVN